MKDRYAVAMKKTAGWSDIAQKNLPPIFTFPKKGKHSFYISTRPKKIHKKAGKQIRNDSIKLFSDNPTLHIFLHFNKDM